VPRGKPLFFPLVNRAYDNCGVAKEDMLSAGELQSLVAALPNELEAIELDIDGTIIGDGVADLAPYLIDVTRFSYTVPAEDSIYQYFGSDFSGRCSPSFSGGYYVMVELRPGHHGLHFSATETSGFTLDVSYDLDVR
jgi:hypothetical protein